MRALLLVAVAPGIALAEPVTYPVAGEGTFDVATTTQIEWHGNNYDGNDYNDDYAVEILRWNLSGTVDETTVGLRLDGAFFQSEADHVDCIADLPPGSLPSAVDACRQRAYLGDPPPYWILHENDLYPERYWVTTRLGPVRPTLGDFTARFGEGLALSIRKVDELGVDTTIRGAQVEVQTERGLRVIGLGGWTNVQNLDPVNQRLIEDPGDLVAGLRVENTFASGLTIGAHYVGYDYLRATSTTPTARGPVLDEMGASVFGAGVRAPGLFDVLDVTAEADVSTGVTLVPDAGPSPIVPPLLVEGPGIDKQPGFGFYESMTLNLERTTVLAEVKSYRNFRFADPTRIYITYHEPPTLERNDMLVLNNANVVAARLRGEHRFWGGGLTVFANLLDGAYDDTGASPFWDLAHGTGGTRVEHFYVGAERRRRSGAFLSGSIGYRSETLIDPAPGAEDVVYAFPHLEVDGGMPISGAHALEAKAWTWGLPGVGLDVTKAGHEYDRASVSLTYSIAPTWAFSVLWGFTSEKGEEIQPRNYLAFQASFVQSEHLTLKAFLAGPWGTAHENDPPALGGRMGGLYCVGGVCRDYPPFEGAQLTALVTY